MIKSFPDEWRESDGEMPVFIKTLQDLHTWTASKWGHRDYLGTIGEDSITWSKRGEIHQMALRLGSDLVRRGVRQGERIGVFSSNNIQTAVIIEACDLFGFIAVLASKVGMITYPMFILQDAAISVLYISDSYLNQTLIQKDFIPTLRFLLLDSYTDETKIPILIFNEVIEGDIEELPQLDPETLSTICYSSGTEGAPKGVCLSHRAVLISLGTVRCVIDGDMESIHVSYLPLGHILERMAIYIAQYRGARVAFASKGHLNLSHDYQITHANCGTTIPAILNAYHHGIFSKSKWFMKPMIWLARTTRYFGFRSRLVEILCKSVKKLIIGDIEWLIVAGDTLDPRIHENLTLLLNVELVPFYGLSECGGLVTATPWRNIHYGSVGVPPMCVDMKINETNHEILAKSTAMFSGYWNNKKLTNDAFIDGYFRTGDVGIIDKGGFLHVPGRIGDMIGIELALPFLRYSYKLCPLVDDLFIYPIRNVLVAIVRPSKESIEEAYGESLTEEQFRECMTPEMKDWILSEINQYAQELKLQANSYLSDIRITFEEFSKENGYLTTTGKLRRVFLAEKFQRELQEMGDSLSSAQNADQQQKR